MNERQRSCKNLLGKLLYPNEWYCGKCKTKYYNKSLAKYCCTIKEK